jgi:sialate O-acetylesterase
MKRILLMFLVLSIYCINVSGKISLPSVFSNNMVLQQNTEVSIWGWSDPGETIKIIVGWNNKDTLKVKANNTSLWKTSIKTFYAGGPYSIQIQGSDKIQITNVMLGEVWVCSGQSNMRWSVNDKILNGEVEAAKSNNPDIRIFHIPRIGAIYPQNNCEADWTVCNPETMRSTSAVGYFFAQELQQKLNVPVGIIVAAWGGTPAEVWIEKSRVENNPELNKVKYEEYRDFCPHEPGVAYNSMITPIVPYGIAGVIWYQGESNCKNYPVYSLLMKTLIENWRSDFKKDFPFYMVQIAPYDYGENVKSQYLREQQEFVTKTVKNSGMVVISDLVDDIKSIHPQNKLDVGKRLANFALAETYLQNVNAYRSPMYQSMQLEKGRVRLTISNVITCLKYLGESPSRFLIAGVDRNFVPAIAQIDGSQIIVSSKLVKRPVAVRFCFDNTSKPDVFSAEGLPLAPFRTDKWKK